MNNKITKSGITRLMAVMLALLIVFTVACLGQNSGDTTPEPITPDVPSDVYDPENASLEAKGAFSITPADGGTAVKASGSVYTITAAGEYVVTGRLENGRIVVNAGEDDEVRIVLNNAYVSSSSAAPIAAVKAGKLIVKSESGSYNTVRDLRRAEEEDQDAAVWASCDLKLSGKGTLIVSSLNNCGVKTKDDLEIKNVVLKSQSRAASLRGSDSVTVESGTLLLVSETSHGIKTSNTDVSGKGKQRGTVLIADCTINVLSKESAISAAYNVEIAPVLNCVLDIRTSTYAGMGSDAAIGILADNEILISGGSVKVSSTGDGLHANSEKQLDNGIASVGNITVSGGDVQIACDDDAIHAGGEFTVSGGNVNVTNSHEGIEANVINIAGGNTDIVGSDDGMNAQKGSKTPLVNITGGVLRVKVPTGGADAIDSNGDLNMSGGTVLLMSGASMGGTAGSVEVKGRINVTGGSLIAIGGVASVPGAGSVNRVIARGIKLSAGSYTVSDGANTVLEFELDEEYSSFFIASQSFALQSSYELFRGSESVISWTQTEEAVQINAN